MHCALSPVDVGGRATLPALIPAQAGTRATVAGSASAAPGSPLARGRRSEDQKANELCEPDPFWRNPFIPDRLELIVVNEVHAPAASQHFGWIPGALPFHFDSGPGGVLPGGGWPDVAVLEPFILTCF